jgi:hypothetical protein
MPNPAKISGSQTKKNKGTFVGRKSSVNIINTHNGRTRAKICRLGNSAGVPSAMEESSNRDENNL